MIIFSFLFFFRKAIFPSMPRFRFSFNFDFFLHCVLELFKFDSYSSKGQQLCNCGISFVFPKKQFYFLLICCLFSLIFSPLHSALQLPNCFQHYRFCLYATSYIELISGTILFYSISLFLFSIVLTKISDPESYLTLFCTIILNFEYL